MDENKLRNIFTNLNKIDFEKMKDYYPQDRYTQFIKDLKKNKINQEISFDVYVSRKIQDLKDFFSFVHNHYKHFRSIICVYDF